MRILGVVLMLACLEGAAWAQPGPGKGIVRGVVVRDSLNTPIANAEVQLAPAGLSLRVKADGSFEFRRVPAGQQRLTVRAVGFNPAEALLTIPTDGVDGLEVALTPTVTTLEKVDVKKDAVPRHLEEFDSRRKFGIGRFLDSTQLWTHGDPSRWFQRVAEQMPGLLLTRAPGGASAGSLAFAARRGVQNLRTQKPCWVRVIIDDQILTGSDEGFDVMSWTGAPIVAAEYYTVSQLPVRYNRLGEQACGALLLWTQR